MSATKPSENILQPKRQNIVLPPVQQLLKPKQAQQQPSMLLQQCSSLKTHSAISPKAINGSSQSSKPRTVTMDKRNARERNRVKLVNQGFQTLKHYIPDDFRIKKMSKVDTLKCALDYIRFLEETLDQDPNKEQLEAQEETSAGFAMTEAEINEHLNKICGTSPGGGGGGGGDDSNISLDRSTSSINSESSPPNRHNSSSSSLILDESAIIDMEDQKPLMMIDASQFSQLAQQHQPHQSVNVNCASALGPQMADIAGVLLPLESMPEGVVSYVDENFNPETVQYVQIVEILALPQ